MSLAPETTVGHYRIVGSLGAGGMGEVYRARDTRLNREVALKVLPDLFADDPDRLARFEREAQTLAGLNHPNIAHIHGIEESGSIHALVMELVEGEDLAQRLKQGAIPLADALSIGRQIADALEAAHERGIVHRDLKPANVKVTDDGRVKVLDFGLAKALDGGDGAAHADAMNSPTLTMRATAMGMILGTAAYMSPEQAKGNPVDRRADVWAFGVVLFEMLTGRRAFDGPDTPEVLAAVMRDTPPLDALPAETPPSIRRLLRRCLERDRAHRLDSMAAARLDIEEALSPDAASAAQLLPAPARPVRRRWGVWAAAGAVGVLAASAAILIYSWTRTPSGRSLRLSANLGLDGHVPFGLNGTIALSPDGRAMAFVGQADGENQARLFYRPLDQLSARVLPDSEAASDPVFSPDGQWIAFFSSAKLKKVSISGGAAVTLADVQTPRGVAWGDDNVISYTPVANAGGKIMRVAAAGGEASALGPAPQGHVTQRWPQALPGNAALLYTSHDNVDNFDNACLVVHPLPAGPPRIVHCGGSNFRYVASGHVLYVHRGTLFALPFDLRSLSASGTAFPVVEGVLGNPASGMASFSAASDGTLAYVPGQSAGEVGLDMIDRSGGVTRLPLAPQNWQSMSFSPDGRQLAIEIGASGQTDIWVYELARDTLTRLTFSNVPDVAPLWTPDGRRIVYASAQGGPPNLFVKSADGSGEERRVSQSDIPQFPQSFDPSGSRLIISSQRHKAADLDLSLMTMDGDVASGLKGGTPRALVSTPANEALGVVSPDGQWMAYASDEGGRYEIYVRALDGSGGRRQISTTGGVWALWSRSRPELVYATLGGQVMVVKYDTTAGSFRAFRPEPWATVPIMMRSAGWPFALHPDGDRIVASTVAGQPDARVRSFVLVTNLFDELRSRAAGK